MYPHEFGQLMSCDEIPVAARRIYAIVTYLHVRPQELYALRWTDVDWVAREVRIRRKLDVRSGEEKPGTKSDAGVREVPIHENLMPLLTAMHDDRASDDERVLPLIGSARLFERFADQTRRHLKAAGIDRTELVDGSVDLMPFEFRSWLRHRAAGWPQVARDDLGQLHEARARPAETVREALPAAAGAAAQRSEPGQQLGQTKKPAQKDRLF